MNRSASFDEPRSNSDKEFELFFVTCDFDGARRALLSRCGESLRWGKYPAEVNKGKRRTVRLTGRRHQSALHIPAGGSWLSTQSQPSNPRSDTLGQIELIALWL